MQAPDSAVSALYHRGGVELAVAPLPDIIGVYGQAQLLNLKGPALLIAQPEAKEQALGYPALVLVKPLELY